jgi:hypothetical protein
MFRKPASLIARPLIPGQGVRYVLTVGGAPEALCAQSGAVPGVAFVPMEQRSAWTDARLDDRFDQIDKRFDRVDREIAQLRADFRQLRTEVQGGFAELRQTMFRWNLTLFATMIGLFATVVVRGG